MSSSLPLALPLAAAGADRLAVPLAAAAPFALLLLAIAVLPLAAGHWWHSNRNKAIIAALLGLPVAAYLVWLGPQTNGASTHKLVHELAQYGSFILLLGSLYTVSGGIVLRGDLLAKPWINTTFLAVGAVLANLIGTTGASMLLIRPVLQLNQERKRTGHIPVFFIFSVSNLGGLLTPLGDPPLFLGYLNGVDFGWTLSLWPQWLLANGLLLWIFFLWDSVAYGREGELALTLDVARREPLRLQGVINFLFLGGILAAVVLQSDKLLGWKLEQPYPEAIMAAMALASWLATPRALRVANAFGWGAIIEVAVLFAGIFVTMVPALAWLEVHGQEFGVREPWQYFWLTGALSSFLDNAPTYLTFATMAAEGNELGWLMTNKAEILAAISCGAVFMGANTYIGNGPNFMVKAIADEAGYKTPSFFGYMLYSAVILLPIFALVTYVFFQPALAAAP